MIKYRNINIDVVITVITTIQHNISNIVGLKFKTNLITSEHIWTLILDDEIGC